MQQHSLAYKFTTCLLAGLVIGATSLRMAVTYFSTFASASQFAIIPVITIFISIVFAVIWQIRIDNISSPNLFLQGLIRLGIAFDLSEFGWAKIFRHQLIMPLNRLDVPYGKLSSSEIFWLFFSHSYTFACIIATLEMVGAMLLLFDRTKRLGIFVLLPVLVNILLMDIFFEVGPSVVAHALVMTAGLVYFLVLDYKAVLLFFIPKGEASSAGAFPMSLKWILRLTIVFVPVLLISSNGAVDKYPALTGKYKVFPVAISDNNSTGYQPFDSTLTTIYFDIKNICIFQFGSPEKRWTGQFTKVRDSINIKWVTPAQQPAFRGVLFQTDRSDGFMLLGSLGKDSVAIPLRKEQ